MTDTGITLKKGEMRSPVVPGDHVVSSAGIGVAISYSEGDRGKERKRQQEREREREKKKHGSHCTLIHTKQIMFCKSSSVNFHEITFSRDETSSANFQAVQTEILTRRMPRRKGHAWNAMTTGSSREMPLLFSNGAGWRVGCTSEPLCKLR